MTNDRDRSGPHDSRFKLLRHADASGRVRARPADPPADDDAWRDDAACRGADTELFFAEGTVGSALGDIEKARLMCLDCAVRAHCLDWALDHGVAFGIWGGLTEDERRALRGTLIRSRLFSA